ncbi:BppU family phage baseplate upper protein, partial [Staphylococcus aureus]|uniref:BppU family phage baseplate upper protein n=1 Tax=Staphylococcus aureus TaxID=1280 RepID=UPI00044F4DEC
MVVDNFSKDDNLIELQTTSQYNPVIDTNISFYESDRGTGVLNFAVTRLSYHLLKNYLLPLFNLLT